MSPNNAHDLASSLIEQLHTTAAMVAFCNRHNNHVSQRNFSSIQSVVLTHGVGRFCIRDRWPGVRRGRVRLCYSNSARLVLSNPDRWIYCEGYGVSKNLGLVVGEHAFCLDRDNGYEVVDRTWRDTKGNAYLGIPFSSAYLFEQLARTKHYGLLDAWWAGWPVLTKPSEEWLHPLSSEIPRDFRVSDYPEPDLSHWNETPNHNSEKLKSSA